MRSAAVLLLLALLLPTTASADDDARRAGQLQTQSQEAFDAGQLDQAMRYAQQAILLNSGPGTWLAQQIRIEVLERKGQIRDAIGYLEDYMALDGLFPEHVAWGREARGRLDGRLIVAEAEAARAREGLQVRRGVGIGCLVGGAAPLATGVGFLANFASKGGGPEYGGWAQAGGALVAVGAAAEVVGAVLVATTASPPPVALVPAPLADGFALALSGTWGAPRAPLRTRR